MIVYLNGRLVAEARVSSTDRGLTLGDGLFETLAAAAGRPLRVQAHLARLRAGADELAIEVPLDDAGLAAALAETLAANGLSEGALRLTLTRGPAPRGLAPPGDARPTLLITASARMPGDGPVTAVVATRTRRNEHSPLARLKTTSALDNVIAEMEAKAKGADEALLLNTRGLLAEAATANLFAVVAAGPVTPPVADGALPGVMRAEVIAETGALERSLAPEDLAAASEAFLTNALSIRPLVAVDGRPIGDGAPGPLTRAVQKIAGAVR